jgi:hypothetical protein
MDVLGLHAWPIDPPSPKKKPFEVVNLLGTDFCYYKLQKIEARNVTKKNDNKQTVNA